jgi:hypothetical protein
MSVRLAWFVGALAAVFAGATASGAPALKNSFCLDCHDDKNLSKTNAAGQQVSLFVDKAQLAASAHKTNTCISCHIDVTVKHPDDHKTLKPVDCATCHDQSMKRENVNAHSVKKTEK